MCEQPLTIILRRPLLALSHLRIYLDIKLNRHLKFKHGECTFNWDGCPSVNLKEEGLKDYYYQNSPSVTYAHSA